MCYMKEDSIFDFKMIAFNSHDKRVYYLQKSPTDPLKKNSVNFY